MRRFFALLLVSSVLWITAREAEAQGRTSLDSNVPRPAVTRVSARNARSYRTMMQLRAERAKVRSLQQALRSQRSQAAGNRPGNGARSAGAGAQGKSAAARATLKANRAAKKAALAEKATGAKDGAEATAGDGVKSP